MEAVRPLGEVVVLDSWAIIAMLNREPCWESVRDTCYQAEHAGIRLPMCTVNWCEVLYSVPRTLRGVNPEDIAELLRGLPIAYIDATEELSSWAAVLKCEYSISLGDAYAAALAMALDVPLLTGDLEFRALEPELVVRWLPRE